MKLKKIVATVFVTVLMLSTIFSVIPSKSSAAEASMYLGIVEKRDDEEFGYAISNPNYGGAKLWRILEYTGIGPTDGLKANGQRDIYCLKEGFGFSDVRKKAEYNLSFDMKSERSDIAEQSTVLSSIVNGNSSVSPKIEQSSSEEYNALLALGDLLYLSGDSEEARTAYLDAAGIRENEAWDKMITDSDIEAVQQAAVWYFTNYGDTSKDYDKTDDTHWLNYTNDGASYESLANYQHSTPDGDTDREGFQRQEQAELLYNYLINTAKANAVNYSSDKISETTSAPAVLTTESLSYEEQGNNYVVGPIEIVEQSGNSISYDIDLKVKVNGAETEEYRIANEEGNQINVSELKNLAKQGKGFYIVVSKNDVTSISVIPNIKYTKTTLTLWTSETGANKDQPVMIPTREPQTDGKELKVTPNVAPFDLALRKYITKVQNGSSVVPIETREPDIDKSSISSELTATYKHRKDPVIVKNGSIVTYNITIYNEGQKAGRATEIVDQLPKGLKFLRVVGENQAFEMTQYNETANNTLVLSRKASNEDNLNPYTGGELDSETIQIECEVTETPDQSKSKILTNVAWISKEYDAVSEKVITNNVGDDRDSEPSNNPNVNQNNMENYIGYAGDEETSGNKSDLKDSGYFYKGEQDDDDFEKLELLPEVFDLKLIKNIVEVNSDPVPERLLSVDVSELNKAGTDGKIVETAEYNMNKIARPVKKGDIVTYRLRIYNEGTLDGYASEITEDIPEGLEFIWSENEGEALKNDKTLTTAEKEAVEFNQKYLWGNFQYDDKKEKIVKISTRYLDIYEGQSVTDETKESAKSTKNLIKAFDDTKGYVDSSTDKNPDYKEVYVKMKVTQDAPIGKELQNEAWISDDSDENGNPVSDRDSHPEDWTNHVEDDEDYDKVIIQSFDLALRKFITKVEEKDVTTRIPKVEYENGKISYEHTKDPVRVVTGNVVTYTIRVFNEGELAGYASEITDDIPDGLEFLPENPTNIAMKWKMIDAEGNETQDVSKAVKITTKYLDIYEGKEISEDATEEEKEAAKSTKNLLKAFRPDSDIVTEGEDLNPDYRDVQVAFKVVEPNSSDRIIVNSAQISEDTDENGDDIEDNDSIPDEWNEGEDDQDREYIELVEFDLALRKWVTQAIVTDSTGTTVTNTGHQPYDDPEQVVKVELNRKKIDQVTVKFRYSIRVINEGDIAGYAKEITDYVPEGLQFIAVDNPGWTDEGNNVISTRLLQDKLLQPGEFADVEVVLTWINNKNNMGVKTNTAEISEDDNEFKAPDRDSTPDNKVPGEDDIDDAPVMLSTATGKAQTYFTLGLVILITIAGGVALIRKYVL